MSFESSYHHSMWHPEHHSLLVTVPVLGSHVIDFGGAEQLFGTESSSGSVTGHHNHPNLALKPQELLALQRLKKLQNNDATFDQLLPQGRWLESGLPTTVPSAWEVPQPMPSLPAPPPPSAKGKGSMQNQTHLR